jgi:two-component system, cell cycle response regulator CpdR
VKDDRGGHIEMARILLAEDDHSLRGFLTRALERAGHSVVDCENGDDAIDALDQGPWDLLLTDIVMPGADGIEVARVAAARQPGIRIMFITGFAAVALSAAQASPQAKVLAKPVHLRDLVGEVERMVAAA